MLQALLTKLSATPLDVQIWECNPLVVLGDGDAIEYGQETNLEFTPFESSTTTIGHAIALKPGKIGQIPQISVNTRQYIDNPLELSRRQGIILQGLDQDQKPVTWLINGAADRYFTTPGTEQIPYDEETAKLLEEELAGSPEKLNLNSFI
jgi:hypothetical protein